MKRLSIINLERALRSGRTPQELGARVIGAGIQNVAYHYVTSKGAEYIIKREVKGVRNNQRTPPKWINEYGARFARTYHVKGWLVQERAVELVNDLDWNHPIYQAYQKMLNERPRYQDDCDNHDMHEANCGINSQGEWIIFDW